MSKVIFNDNIPCEPPLSVEPMMMLSEERHRQLITAEGQLRAIYRMVQEYRKDPDFVADLVWYWADIQKGL